MIESTIRLSVTAATDDPLTMLARAVDLGRDLAGLGMVVTVTGDITIAGTQPAPDALPPEPGEPEHEDLPF